MTKSGWPEPVRGVDDLKKLAEELATDLGGGEWHWNSYSGIGVSVPKGHDLDDSVTVEEMKEWGMEPDAEALSDTGYAWVLHVNQAPAHEGRGDELHHPIPRKIAKFAETVDPKMVLALIEGAAGAEFDSQVRAENDLLRARVDQLYGLLKEKNRQLGFYPDGRTPLPKEQC